MRTALLVVALLAGLFLARDLVANVTAERAPTVTFHADGSLRSSVHYEDGVPSGLAEEYYVDGSPASRGRYDDGVRSGSWTFWTREGEVDAGRSGTYRDGRKLD
jgi:antitoxin component YwqK of YwqJK toxin-antitoxin module